MKLDSARVAIIGGGCVGLSAAYYLAKAGASDVVVIEGDYLGSGATGRCAGGMRQQWSTEGNVRLAKMSIEAFAGFEAELGQDIEFRQGGYLLTAYTPERLAALGKDVELQNSCGVNTRMVEAREVAGIAPMLSAEGLLGAAYGPTDGKANPFLVVKGYAERAREMGVRIHLRTEVTGLETSGDAVVAVQTSRGRVAAEWVINAAGGRVGEIAELAGVGLPIDPYRRQIIVTEPVQRCHDPMIIDLDHNIFFCQAAHGAFLAGQSDKGQPSGLNLNVDWRFAAEVSGKLTRLLPRLAGLRVLRHWAGTYAVSPDRQPVLGRVGDYRNFLVAGGFSGHGFMLAPACGVILSEMALHGRAVTLDAASFAPDRFDSGELVVEANVV